MKSHWFQGSIVFVIFCCMGLFVAAAGGVTWGTEEAGASAAITLLIANVLGAIVGTRSFT